MCEPCLVFGPRSWLGKWKRKRKAEMESWNGRLKRKAEMESWNGRLEPIQYKHRNTRALEDDFRPSKRTSQFSLGLCWMGITLWVFDIWRHTVTTVTYFRSYNWGEPERAPPGQFNGCAVYLYISHNMPHRTSSTRDHLFNTCTVYSRSQIKSFVPRPTLDGGSSRGCGLVWTTRKIRTEKPG